jgi:AcrR family transcriptional regulator
MEKPLKEKTAALRRQHILEAAARQFAEAGYQRTTIRDIAMAAGVADGTVYNCFANKADLLLSLLDPLHERMPAGDDVAVPAFPASPEGITALVRDRWAGLTPDVLDLLRVVLSEGLVDRAVGEALLLRVLGPAILPVEQGMAGRGTADAALAARVAVATFLGCAVLRMLGDPVLQAQAETVPDRIGAILAALFNRPEAH